MTAYKRTAKHDGASGWHRPFVSVIIPTYNGTAQLRVCLRALSYGLHDSCEIIIADDGSTGVRTREVIDQFMVSCPVRVHHAWQQDRGFRAATARNLGVHYARGEILVFLDHDIVVPPNFVDTVRACMIPGWFAGGRRVHLDKGISDAVLTGDMPCAKLFTLRFGLIAYRRKLPGWRFLAPLRDRRPGRKPQPWRGMASFAFAAWREDFIAVDGFDSRYEDYGYGVEDWDLFARLVNLGIKPAYLPRSATVAHLWHEEQAHDLAGPAYRLLDDVERTGKVRAERGFSTIDQAPV